MDHISNIMSKLYDIFARNVIVIVSNAGKTGNVQELEFDKS